MSIPCSTCGNTEYCSITTIIEPGKGTMEVCDMCDPLMRCEPIADYVCPYNCVNCMDRVRNGNRTMCSCFGAGCDITGKGSNTSFCSPNRSLIEYLIKTNINRIIDILRSEKQKMKYFVCTSKIDNLYQIQIMRGANTSSDLPIKSAFSEDEKVKTYFTDKEKLR